MARRAAQRCDYCLLHEDDAGFPHQVDHIVSRKHGGSSTSENLAYACLVCNRHKGSDVASINPVQVRLSGSFNPRSDRCADHFRIEGAVIEPVSSTGSATESLLRLNAPERISERALLQSLGRYP